MKKDLEDQPTNSSRSKFPKQPPSSSNCFELLTLHISELKTMLVDFNQKLTNWKYKIENGKGWASSAERQEFFDLVKQARGKKEKTVLEIKGAKINHHSQLNPKGEKRISKSEETGAKLLEEPIQRIFDKYFGATTFSIEDTRREQPVHFPSYEVNGHWCFEVSNIFSAINVIITDQYYTFLKDQYNQYLVAVLATDLSWVNNNPTLPPKYSYINQHIVRKLYIQLASKLSSQRMYDIIEQYDAELIVEIIWRQIFYNNDIVDKEELKDLGYFPEGFLMADHLRHVMRGYIDETIVFGEDYYEISITVFEKKAVVTCVGDRYYVRYEGEQ